MSVRPPLPSERKYRQNIFNFQAINSRSKQLKAHVPSHCISVHDKSFDGYSLQRCKETYFSYRFLKNFNILVDMRNSRLLETHTHLRVLRLVSHKSSTRNPQTILKLFSQNSLQFYNQLSTSRKFLIVLLITLRLLAPQYFHASMISTGTS